MLVWKRHGFVNSNPFRYSLIHILRESQVFKDNIEFVVIVDGLRLNPRIICIALVFDVSLQVNVINDKIAIIG